MKQWYYARDSQTVGPIPEDQLVGLLNAGQLDANVYVWTQGFPNWLRAVDATDLSFVRSQPPALPMAMPAAGANERDDRREKLIRRIRTFSHIVDWTIFLGLIFFTDISFIIALVVSIGTGWLIRWAFCR